MSKSAISLLFFALYLFFIGSVLTLIPNFLLNIFNLPNTNEVWIRVLGVSLLVIGFYYFLASKNEMKNFFQWTVYARSSVIFIFILFVILKIAPPIVILFGLIDISSAIWTHFSLKSERKNKLFLTN